jgi:hypothetical protein
MIPKESFGMSLSEKISLEKMRELIDVRFLEL